MITLRDLFLEKRFLMGWKRIPILIYLPLGLILATVRVFIGLQAILAASILQTLEPIRSVTLRLMFIILGIIVIKENEEAEDESVKIVVSNHVSIFDHVAIHLLRNSYSVSNSNLPSLFQYGFNYKNFGNNQNQEMLVENVKSFIRKDVTVDVQPEMGITSGRKGLLRFSSWPCKLSCPIQPVTITLWRPVLNDVSPSVLNASWFSDVFWFFFVPFTVFKIKYIPVVKPVANESPEDMSKRLEKCIADELNVVPANYTVNDKIELEKRLTTEKKVVKQQPPLEVSVNSGLVDMVSKVKEVLPDVPLNVIYKDLVRTKSVDLTIANFLEGLVKYTPEVSQPVTMSANVVPENGKLSSEATTQPSTSFDTSSKTFHKSAQERMVSFQERKLRLIQNARQRYIEKHALNLINSS